MPHLADQALRDLKARRDRAAAQMAERRRELVRAERRVLELEDVIKNSESELDRLDALIERAEDTA